MFGWSIIFLPSDQSDEGEELRSKCAAEIGSKSLSFDPSYGGTLVEFSFDKAHLTKKLFKALRKYRCSPSYTGK
jgi:hypothetical protein